MINYFELIYFHWQVDTPHLFNEIIYLSKILQSMSIGIKKMDQSEPILHSTLIECMLWYSDVMRVH